MPERTAPAPCDMTLEEYRQLEEPVDGARVTTWVLSDSDMTQFVGHRWTWYETCPWADHPWGQTQWAGSGAEFRREWAVETSYDDGETWRGMGRTLGWAAAGDIGHDREPAERLRTAAVKKRLAVLEQQRDRLASWLDENTAESP